MPQMMPINWIMSLFYFNLIFIMFIMMNYYIFINNYDNKISIKKINIKNLLWKW